MDSLNGEARDFMARLLKEADNNKAAVEERAQITFSNIDILTHLYLIKALFKPRQQT